MRLTMTEDIIIGRIQEDPRGVEEGATFLNMNNFKFEYFQI